MGKSEAEVKKRVRTAFTKLTKGITFNNAVGIAYMGTLIKKNKDIYTIKGRKAAIGFGRGTSDLIGIRTIEITPDMVGKKIGQFVALEVKKENWHYTGNAHEREQHNFINVINNLGGLAGFVNSEDSLNELINKKYLQ